MSGSRGLEAVLPHDRAHLNLEFRVERLAAQRLCLPMVRVFPPRAQCLLGFELNDGYPLAIFCLVLKLKKPGMRSPSVRIRKAVW
jgi:hypothetical protein